MGEYLISGETVKRIADAIRERTGADDLLTPEQMAEKIGALADPAAVTAESEDVLTGKVFVDAAGNVREGTMPLGEATARILTADGPSVTLPGGYYADAITVVAASESAAVTPTKQTQTVLGGTDGSGTKFLEFVTVEPIPDEYRDVSGVTAAAGDVLAGKVFVDAAGNQVEGTLVAEEYAGVGNLLWGSGSDGTSDGLVSNGIIRYVTFMNHDGSVEYGRKSVLAGDNCADPVTAGYLDAPARESDVQYTYTFSGGWATEANGGLDSNALKAVSEDRTVYANFVSALRYYTVTFYDDDGTTVLETQSVAYGCVPVCTPEKSGYSFVGWDVTPVAVTGEASYTAVWTEKITFAGASWATIAEISESGQAASHFAVGDTKTITFNGETVTIAIAGFDHDDLADGTGKAGITCVAVDIPSVTTTYGNHYYTTFSGSKLKTALTDWVAYLPAALQSVIKSVNKTYEKTYDTGTSPTLGTVSCKLFPLSFTEVGGTPYNTTYYTALGTRYDYFPLLSGSQAAAAAYQVGTTTKATYWLRGLMRVGQAQPLYVAAKGQYTSSSYDASHGVRFGFCV